METFATIVGYVLMACLAVGLVSLMVYSAASRCEDVIEKIRQDSRSMGHVEVGRRAGADAWWFSEDVVTMNLLRTIAQELQAGRYPDVDSLREQWRKERATQAVEWRSDALAYQRLLMAVGNKFPNETRHQTALRYIEQAERTPSEAANGKVPGRPLGCTD